MRGDKVSLDDESPFSEEVNRLVIEPHTNLFKNVFGTESPFQVSWSFEARNLSTGQPIGVEMGANASPNSVSAEVLSGRSGKNTTVRIKFPKEASDVYELVATVKITDSFGNSGESRHTVWSHVLAGTTHSDEFRASVVGAVADMAGLPRENVNADVQPTSDSQRLIRVASTFAAQAAEDGRISIEELRRMVTFAQRLH